jgi:hypothetical protein
MLNSATSSQFLLKYGAPAQAAYDALSLAIGVDNLVPASAESFAVKLMEMLTMAETALPEAQKQNNFGYGIGEGGAYRGTIKAAVVANFTVMV